MQVSISKAHQLTGVARSTIYKDIENGTLSYNKGTKGKKEIMVSELQRVYGNFKPTSNDDNKEVSENVVERPKEGKTLQPEQVAVLQERIRALEEKILDKEVTLEDIRSERTRSREQYQEQIEIINTALGKAQDGQNRLTLQLEDKRGGTGEWQKSLKALEARIANQEAAEKTHKEREEKLLKRARQYEAAYKKEKSKTFFQKLFG